MIPDYIAERIRRAPPPGVRVVARSTPVIAFGDVRRSKVATLGWNPSKLEFLDNSGMLLDGSRRLETTASLIADGLALDSPEAITRVFEACNGYFQLRPYRRWFDVLEKVLRHVGASYYDGSACHLDLVQWATDPVWGKLQEHEQRTLLKSDIPFLSEQLAQENIRVLLLNGAGIMQAYQSHLSGHLIEVTESANGRLRVFTNRPNPNLTVVGWNINLQSSWGVSNEEIGSIGKQVGMIVNRP